MISRAKLPAVILAAGKGERLGKLTESMPKPMIRVNDIRIIDNLIEKIIRNGIGRIVLVTGYKHNVLEKCVSRFKNRAEMIIIENPVYDKTNNIYSLWMARNLLNEGFYLFEADIFFDNGIMAELVNSDRENIIVAGRYNSKMDGTVIDIDADCRVQGMYLKIDQKKNASFDFSDKYKTVNFYRIGSRFCRDFFLDKMREHIERKDLNSYYEIIIKEAISSGYDFRGLKTGNHRWWEIDNREDLEYCEKMFGG